MNRRSCFQTVRGAFLYVYVLLLLLVLRAVCGGGVWEMGLLLFGLAVCLLAKRKLLLDLLTGETAVFQGRLAYRENASWPKKYHVEYLVEETTERPQRFVWFPGAVPLPPRGTTGLLTCPVTLRYLRRSWVVVAIEAIDLTAPSPWPKPRTKAWYACQAEREQDAIDRTKPRACPFHKTFWFIETLLFPVLLVLLLFLLARE